MATTTNYSWTTPDDTDLVKDGAAAIRTLGSSADTTVKALNPGTTAGDIDYYTTSTAKARVGIGTAGQVLAVNSGATAPEWVTPAAGGGITLLSTTTLSGASTTISAISQDYTNLVIVGYGLNGLTANGAYRLAPNGTTNLVDSVIVQSGGPSTESRNDTYAYILGTPSYTVVRTGTVNSFTCTINNYADTSLNKPISIYCGTDDDNYAHVLGGIIGTTSAITSLAFDFSGGNLNGGTILVYGVK